MNELLRRLLLATYMEAAEEGAAGGGDGDAGGEGGAGDEGGEGGAGGEGGQGDGDEGGQGDDGNWRTAFGDDLLPTLERYKSPADMGKAFMEMRKQIKEGKASRPLPENATEDDIKEWREANGIPAEASEYFDALPEGTQVGEEERSLYEGLAGVLHQNNVPPAVFNDIYEWANKLDEEIGASQLEEDRETARQMEETLRDEWGNSEYRANINVMQALIKSQLGEDGAAKLLGARAPDGTSLFNDREVIEMFVKLGREQNPIGSILEGGSGSTRTAEDRLDEIKKMRRENYAEYIKDEKIQAEERKLLDVLEKQKAATSKT